MAGKLFHNRKIKILLLLWFFLGGAPARGAGFVAILQSDSEDAYSLPLKTFEAEVEHPTKVFNLHGDISKAEQIMAEIVSQKPSLIFALGAKASYTAKLWTAKNPEIPVIFTMVLNWRKYGLLDGQDNIAGISFEVSPGTQFANMLLFAPDVRRIGVIYSEDHSSQIMEEARREAGLLGLELVAVPVERPKDFIRAFKMIDGRIDGFWIMADPVIYSLENISWLEKRCLKGRLACIGQSKNIAEHGVFMAVEPDIPNIGSQAASLAKKAMAEKESVKKMGVMPPLGTKLFLNMRTADRLERPISSTAMDMASEILN